MSKPVNYEKLWKELTGILADQTSIEYDLYELQKQVIGCSLEAMRETEARRDLLRAIRNKMTDLFAAELELE